MQKQSFLFARDSTWPSVTKIYWQKLFCTADKFHVPLILCLLFLVADCKHNWHQYKTGCVQLFTLHEDFNQARQYCNRFQTSGGVQGDLVKIMSKDDNDRIYALASERGLYRPGTVSNVMVALVIFSGYNCV